MSNKSYLSLKGRGFKNGNIFNLFGVNKEDLHQFRAILLLITRYSLLVT